jgi:hypothetical protein
LDVLAAAASIEQRVASIRAHVRAGGVLGQPLPDDGWKVEDGVEYAGRFPADVRARFAQEPMSFPEEQRAQLQADAVLIQHRRTLLNQWQAAEADRERARMKERRAAEAKDEVEKGKWYELDDNDEPIVRPTCSVPELPTPTIDLQQRLRGGGLKYSKPIDFFGLCWGDPIWKRMATATEHSPYRRATFRSTVTVAMLKAFFGCMLLMGMMRAANVRWYWEVDMRWGPVASVFPRDTFLALMAMLWVRWDNERDDGSDRFWPVRNLVTALNTLWSKWMTPGKDTVVDETMIRQLGRENPAVMVMHNKPIKKGFKAWTAAAKTAYTYRQHLYPGKVDGVRDEGLTMQVVLELLDGLGLPDGLGGWRRVTMDSYYTGVPLFDKLYRKQWLALGTVHPHRKYRPAVWARADQALGVCTYSQNAFYPHILAIRWRKDNGDVRELFSTDTPWPLPAEDPAPAPAPAASAADPSGAAAADAKTPVPLPVQNYNRTMFGVDYANQFAASYTPWRKSYCWWFSIICHYFHVGVVNAYVMYSVHGDESLPNMSFSDFTKQLARELIGDFSCTSRRGRPPSNAHCAIGKGTKSIECRECGKYTSAICTTCTAVADDHPYAVCCVCTERSCWADHVKAALIAPAPGSRFTGAAASSN